jgi:hypothetical protein
MYKTTPTYILHRNCWVWITIVIVVILTTAIRIRVLEVPLDRDEGGYAYMAQLLLQGFPPYTEAYDVRFPGIYCIYALIMAIFGQNHISIHFGLLIANIATVFLIFLLGRRLFNSWTGVVAGASYAILTLSPGVQGFSANVEHFVVLLAVGGILLLLDSIDSGRLPLFLLSGILFGIAVIIKQHGVLFSVFGAGYIISIFLKGRPFLWKSFSVRFGLFLLGVILPIALTFGMFFLLGVFSQFFFWTFIYAAKYVSMVSISAGLANFANNLLYVVRPNFLLWFACLFGVTVFFWDKEVRSQLTFIMLLFIGSFLALCPGLYFRSHYFIFLFPVVSLLVGVGINAVYRLLSNINSYLLRIGITVTLAIIVLVTPLITEGNFFFFMSPNEVSRRVYMGNPFPESFKIANYIKQHTSEDDRIVVFGSEPQIYFYSKRRTATRYIYPYLLMSPHKFAIKMQKEMIRETEANQPKYLVFVKASTSWLMKAQSEKLIVHWIPQYIEKYYNMVGIIDVLSSESEKLTVYKWEDEVSGYSTRSSCNLFVFRRKEQ